MLPPQAPQSILKREERMHKANSFQLNKQIADMILSKNNIDQDVHKETSESITLTKKEVKILYFNKLKHMNIVGI